MKETLAIINQMQADGIIESYAIGGAVGATFYLEPAATVDLDVFVTLPPATGLLISLTPIYEYLKAHGGVAQDEYIVIGNWPVQFLAAGSELELEALRDAVAADVEGVTTSVMSAEHLVAIALQTGRSKDHNRILQFLDQDSVDREKLRSILERNGLIAKWQQFERRYLDGAE